MPPTTRAHNLPAKCPKVPAGLYVEQGISGTVLLSVYDDAGVMIREDHVAYEHLTSELFDEARRWGKAHRRHRGRVA